MLSPLKVLEVRRLLAEGATSRRQIARLTGVSRSSVGLIAAGKRRDREAAREPPIPPFEPRGPLARCPNCGGRVLLPCLLCHVRAVQARREKATSLPMDSAYSGPNRSPCKTG